ncbi:rap guanine nucleotide exchange factor 6-like isoform X2 [Tubulanus polymorphus]|uniref:rap guanine nucleotide exchange factor 6-like isoform X2 n=1 Tax=Tubulanus polymorphus TaxID=672921 RepID=UPI003DA47C2B
MSSYFEHEFHRCLQTPPNERTAEDLDIIFSFLHGLEALSNLRETALRTICRRVRYEHYDANDILYCYGEPSSSWYILLTGCVFIENSMYLPRSSFGKRTAGCNRRQNECLVLEPSDMVVIDYPEVHMKPTQHLATCANMDNYANNDNVRMPPPPHSRGRLCSDPYADQLELQVPPNRNEHFLHAEHVTHKRNSRASDTSSAYSGSDMMQSSIDDQELPIDVDLNTALVIDSDDEDVYSQEMNESIHVRDTVRECLEKDPADRTEDDIEVLLEFMQHFNAFSCTNMTLATRREFCAVMVFAVVEKAGTIVMNDGEELDSWSVILNGQVEVIRPNGTTDILEMGSSFGITPTMEKLYHKGVMITRIDDCQFVCIAQADYYRILHQGEENTVRHEEEGKVTFVTEKRVLDGGNRKGHIVIRATPERLLSHLVEEHSPVDPTYVEDFLLTFRTFLDSPMEVANKLQIWFNDPNLRDRVTRVVLLWVNEHFNDFESNPELGEFLEKFERLLEREKMGGQMRLLSIACAAKAKPRTVTLTRATRDEILHFSVLGGIERHCGIFISKVEKTSKAHEAGLKRGDQIIEVNGFNFENVSHNRALEILRGTTHLSITVRSNLLAFRDSILVSDGSPPQQDEPHQRQRLSTSDLDGIPPIIGAKAMSSSLTIDKKSSCSTLKVEDSKRTKIKKMMKKMNLLTRNGASDTSSISSAEDGSVYSAGSHIVRSRNSSFSGPSSSSGMSMHLSASNPDLSSVGYGFDDSRNDFPEHVVKVYRADQTCKYFLVHKETTAREVVMLALKEFGISDPSCNYSLCEVTAESENFIKQKRLPDQLANLPERISLNGRYYLKNNMLTETFVSDDKISELLDDGRLSLLQLREGEIATQLTLDDFKVFRSIEQTEYIDDLFKLKSGTSHLKKFEELADREMFWVVTEIASESNIQTRMRIVKHFIKIAKLCKECKNFNSMFAILSGLDHSQIARLRNTWDKLPSKYMKMFQDLKGLMDPSRNMSKYRNLLNSDHVQPPMIPFFPIVKKDMTFINLGNDSIVDNLVNMEKLRMLAKEIRHVHNMCTTAYNPDTMFSKLTLTNTTFAMFANSSNLSGNATMRRKSRRASTIPNPKKMYEEAQMVRRVRSYIQNVHIIFEEDKLKELSHKWEPPAGSLRKRDNSPTMSNTSVDRPLYQGPKFGAESPDAVRKLMSLSEKVKPLNPKHGYTSNTPPRTPPRGQLQGRQPLAGHHSSMMHLSPESSSVFSLNSIAASSRKSKHTGATVSAESGSPTSLQPLLDNDSGHNSVTSSNYDTHSINSASSAGSGSSPTMTRRAHPPMTAATLPPTAVPHPISRPALPPYSIAVQNKKQAYSNYIHQQYTQQTKPPIARRPPVPPDYYAATQMAQLVARRKQLQDRGRSHSHEGVVGRLKDHHFQTEDDTVTVTDAHGQISAV